MSVIGRVLLPLTTAALGAVLVVLGLVVRATNVLGWFLMLAGVAYGLGGAVYLALEGRKRAVREEAGDRSLWLIVPGFATVFFGAPLEYVYLPETLPRVGAMQVAGVALLLAALLLRLWTRIALRGMYSGHIQTRPEHHLVQAGPYRFVRHPGYTGFVLMLLALAIGFSSIVGLAAIPLLALPGLAHRMRVEETLLTEQFGDAYRAYVKRTKRLVPGIW